VTRIEVDALRLRCRAASDAHHDHLATLLDLSKGGTRPPLQVLHAEEQALYELAKIRREYLDALDAISQRVD
jgi:hypothetical protein